MDLKWIPVALGATVVGLALYQASKVHQIEKALSTTVNSMADMTTVTIQDEMVKRAVEKATDREVGNAIQTASRSIQQAVKTEMNDKVRAAVSSVYADIQAPVRDRIALQVSSIDVDALKKAVTEQSKKEIVEKLKEGLEDALSDFRKNLKGVSTIYEALTSQPRSEITFRVI